MQLQTFVNPKSHESADGGKFTVHLGSAHQDSEFMSNGECVQNTFITVPGLTGQPI